MSNHSANDVTDAQLNAFIDKLHLRTFDHVRTSFEPFPLQRSSA